MKGMNLNGNLLIPVLYLHGLKMLNLEFLYTEVLILFRPGHHEEFILNGINTGLRLKQLVEILIRVLQQFMIIMLRSMDNIFRITNSEKCSKLKITNRKSGQSYLLMPEQNIWSFHQNTMMVLPS